MVKEYTTKDSGKRKVFDTQMQRDTEDNKPRFDLITPLNTPYNETLLYRWAMLMERGRQKYNARNWEKACTQEEYDRFKASAWRHFMQLMCEEDDEDHYAAVCFNLQGMLHTKGRIK